MTVVKEICMFNLSKENSQIVEDAANAAGVVIPVSAALSLVQSPLRRLKNNRLLEGKFFVLPPSKGFLALVRYYGAGTFSLMGASTFRGTYIINVKKNSTINGNEGSGTSYDKPVTSGSKFKPYLMAIGKLGGFSAGETLFTQPELISDLKALNLKFNWKTSYNLWKISTTGLGLRYTTTLINFTGICLVSDLYYHYLPIPNDHLRNSISGFLSGVTAASVTFFPAHARDVIVAAVQVSSDGKLLTPVTSRTLTLDFFKACKEGKGKDIGKDLGRMFVNYAPLLMLRYGITFLVVNTLTKAIGPIPYTRTMSFFSEQRSPSGDAEQVTDCSNRSIQGKPH